MLPSVLAWFAIGCADPIESPDGDVAVLPVNAIIERQVGIDDTAAFLVHVSGVFAVLPQVVSGVIQISLHDSAGGIRHGGSLLLESDGAPLGRHDLVWVAGEPTWFRIVVTGPGRLRLQVYVPDPAPEKVASRIVPNDTVSGEDLHSRIDRDVFVLEGRVGDELIAYLHATGPAGTGTILLAIDGPGLAQEFLTSSRGGDPDLQSQPSLRFTLPASGPYSVSLSTDSYAGPYRFQLRRVERAPEHLSRVAIVNSISAGEQIDYVGDIDEFSVEGMAGDYYNVFFRSTSPSAGAVVLQIPEIGTPPFHPEVVSSGQEVVITARATGRFQLPESGRVTVRISASDIFGLVRGSYEFYIARIDVFPEAHGPTMAPGDSVMSERIDAFGDIDDFRIVFPTRDTVNLVLNTGSGAVMAQLLAAGTGDTMASTGLAGGLEPARSGPVPIEAGEYVIRVLGVETSQGGSPGPYQVFAYRIRSAPETASGTVAIGDSVVESLSPIGDSDVFLLQGRRGDHIEVMLGPREPAPAAGLLLWMYLQRLCHPIGRGVSLPGATDASSTKRITLPEDGIYEIHMIPGGNQSIAEATGNYRLSVHRFNASPEQHDAELRPGDVVTDERIDFPGDLDEFMLRGVYGTEVEVGFIVAFEESTMRGVWIEVLDPSTQVLLHAGIAMQLDPYKRIPFPPSGALLLRVGQPRVVTTFGNDGFDSFGSYRLETRAFPAP
jgi:hypothetical protein